MKLKRTINLISKCWLKAEQRVCTLISTKYSAHDEVFITRLLNGEVKEEFNNVNEDGTFEKIFSEDLASGFNDRKLADEVSRLSKGIIAKITYHEPPMEKISGADFGLAVVKPYFERTSGNLLKYSMQRQGLLCQAKRQKADGKIGQLTPNQIAVLPNHLKYFALLFYLYSEKERINLLPFSWWSDNNYNSDIDDVTEFLMAPDIKETVGSKDIIRSLGDGHVGTDDQEVIDSIICPEEQPHIIVEITWHDGFPPKPPDDPKPRLSFSQNRNFGSIKSQQQNFRRRIHRPQVQHVKKRAM